MGSFFPFPFSLFFFFFFFFDLGFLDFGFSMRKQNRRRREKKSEFLVAEADSRGGGISSPFTSEIYAKRDRERAEGKKAQ